MLLSSWFIDLTIGLGIGLASTTRVVGGVATKRPTCAAVAALNAERLPRGVPDAQRAWWALALAGGLVAMLGFQTLPPSRRLDAIEAANARQDSVFAVQAAEQRVARDTIKAAVRAVAPGGAAYPASLDVPAKRALYDNLGRNEELALAVDAAVRTVIQDDWRNGVMKTKKVRLAIAQVIPGDDGRIDAILALVRQQHDY